MSLPKPEFAHLHVHTEYSLLDGACRLDQLCDRAKELNFEQIAVTDHGSMSGLLTLQKAADKAGIKPILGIEAYQAPIHRTERDNDNRYYHITLLAESDEGFLNLSRMNYHAAREGMYYAHPRMDMELLKQYGEGVIVLTGCMAGAVMQALIRADKEPDQRKREHAARDEILKLADAVGKENVYIEVQNSGVKDYGSSQWEWNAQLQKIAKDLDMTIVGTSDTHYLDADPSKGPRYGTPYYHELLLCVQTKKHTIHTPPSERMSLIHDWDDPHYYHLRSAAEMREMLSNVPESVGNSLLVAERCNARIHTGRTFEMLPDFPVPDDYRAEGKQPETMDEKVWRQESYLREKVYEGLRRLYGDPIPGEVVERAEYELGVINSMGTTSYFLITWDWIRYAREIGIVCGPGRGSGAGSLVCYALDITRLDPLKFGLLFERFLSPDRISMPDIDTDVSGRQEEIRAYLNEKYGEENCAQIITFQTIGGKAGILSAAKAIGGHDLQGLARKMSSAMPMKGQVPVSLSEALDKDSGHYGVELNQIINNSPEAKQIIEAAQWMEGLVSAESVHAAAFVISPFALTDALPVVVNKDGFNVTAFAMKEAEEVGVLKLDLLGLRNLQILADAQDLIKKRRGIEVNAKEYEIPLEDKKTYDMLAKGESVGVFQFESTGMQDTLKTIGVTEFNDLIAIVAAYRPGAMDQIPTYARRKRGIEEVTYGDPRMEQHLKETYGGVLYQEQAMLLARDLAGFTGGLMDKLRKAIGKKNMELMMELKPIFFDGTVVQDKKTGEDIVVPGCVKNGVPRATAEWIWSVFEASASYSFNKCASGDTRIRLGDGSSMRLSEAYKKQPKEAMSMWPDGSFRPHKIKRIVQTGRKPVYRIRTESNRTIKITKEHRLLTTEGYIPLSEMKVGTELIVAPTYSDEERQRRSEYMKSLCERPERKEQDKRAAERMREWQASRTPEEKAAHMKAVHAANPHMTDKGVAAMHEKIRWLRANDPEWVARHTEASIASVRATYNTGPGFGHCSIASNGMWCASNNERAMCEWLIEQGIEFEMHKVLANGRICDFYFDGVYWEMDGMDRTDEYFAEKYGDLPYVVVTPEDYKAIVAKHMNLDHAENGDPIVSIEYSGEQMTYDVEMERGGPLNFVANRIVSHNSHAACYALIGYATAYLKANFPAEYMAALISSVMHTKDKVPFYVYECKRMGLKVLPPSVNESFSNFEPTADDTLRFGLTAISGVGEGVVEGIVAEREANGPYRSLWDFCDRVTNINSRELNNLIKAGAFDWVGKPRKGLLSVSDQALKRSKKVREKKAEGQDSLFDFGSSVEAELSGLVMETHPEIPDERFSDDEMYALEREVTKGIYVTGHPLDSCRRQWERVRHLGIGQIGPEQLPEPDDVDDRGKPRYKVVTVAGIVTNRRTLFTKRDNKRWLILTLEDLTGANEILLFNRELTEGNEEYLEEGSKIWMRVSVEEDKSGFGSQAGAEEGAEDGRQVKLIGKAYGKFDPATVDVPDFYDVKLPFETVQVNPEMVRQIVKVLKEHPGEEQSRILLMQEDEVVSSYATNVAVEPSEQLTQALKSALS